MPKLNDLSNDFNASVSSLPRPQVAPGGTTWLHQWRHPVPAVELAQASVAPPSGRWSVAPPCVRYNTMCQRCHPVANWTSASVQRCQQSALTILPRTHTLLQQNYTGVKTTRVWIWLLCRPLVSLYHCLVVLLSCCPISHCLVVSLSRCLIVVLSCCLVISLSLCLIVPLSRCTVVLLSCCPVVDLSCFPVSWCHIVPFTCFLVVVLSCCPVISLSHCPVVLSSCSRLVP